MISRYTRPEFAELWSEENKLQIWFEVELAAVEGWAEQGVVPRDAADHIRDKAVLDVERDAITLLGIQHARLSAQPRPQTILTEED